MPLGHKCDLLCQWLADPRCPIEEKSGGYFLSVNPGVNLKIAFCPFCGEATTDQAATGPPPTWCEHLKELSAPAGSPVRRHRESGDYELLGSDSLKIRLFFCPVCGMRLPLSNNASDFCEISPNEMSKWKQAFEGVRSIDDALERFGAPDQDQGPVNTHFYPRGRYTEIQTKRCLFYDNLAGTFTIVALEWLDGSFEVKFYPKEKAQKPSNEH
jgi:hypothetical protein